MKSKTKITLLFLIELILLIVGIFCLLFTNEFHGLVVRFYYNNGSSDVIRPLGYILFIILRITERIIAKKRKSLQKQVDFHNNFLND